mmetsp:Transcript_804/g.2003  ORF Transcript_804/g.2003 Transcript_804/m.2003 type:complete len:135 (-) Transcript_804:485-889(-)
MAQHQGIKYITKSFTGLLFLIPIIGGEVGSNSSVQLKVKRSCSASRLMLKRFQMLIFSSSNASLLPFVWGMKHIFPLCRIGQEACGELPMIEQGKHSVPHLQNIGNSEAGGVCLPLPQVLDESRNPSGVVASAL